MKTNVAEFIQSTYDGGAETLIKDYCLHIDKSEFNIIVIAFRRNANTAVDTMLRENGIRIISIYKNNSFLLKVIQKINSWWYVPYKLKRIIREENINVLHGHVINLRWLYRIREFLWKCDLKLFYTCHNVPERYFCGRRKRDGDAAKYLVKHNELQLIALHQDMKLQLEEMFDINNVIVIRNGVDFKRFNNVSESKRQIRNELGISSNAFVVGHIGRFHYQKNHDYLISVFGEIYKRNPNAFLLLIGTGNLMNDIRTKIKHLGLENSVLILSNRTDIPQLLKAMDVFVFPSRFEGLSVTLVEAQVSGLRCIVSDRVNRETIMSDKTVLLSIDDSPKKWCQVILDPSIKGKSYSNMEEYDINKEIKHIEKMYAKLDNYCK